MMYPLVRELATDGIPVTVTCRVLKIARQPYYRWLAQPVTDAELIEAYRADALFDAHGDDPEFGYRLLADEAWEAGEPMAERTAWRICSALGWWSVFGKRRGKNGKKPGPPVRDDLCAVVDKHGVTRHEREHQWPAAPVLSEGHQPGQVECRGDRGRRSRPQHQTPQDSRLEDSCRGVQRPPTISPTSRCCFHQLNPVIS